VDAHVNELLKRCYKILALEEDASPEHVVRAAEILKEFHEERAAHVEAGEGPELWEQLKEIAWAKDTLLEYLQKPPTPAAPDDEKQNPRQGKLTSETPAGGDGNRQRPWWLSSVAVGIAVVLFCSVYYYFQSRHAVRGQGRQGSSWNQGDHGTQPSDKSGGAVSDQPGDLPQLLQEVKKGVVTLQFGRLVGSGFLVSDDGYIATNAHVVNALKGAAQFAEGESIEVNLVKMEPEKDFALLKTASGSNYPFLRLGDSNTCREGDTVIAVGSPYNLQLSFTKGIVSAKNRKDPRLSVSLIQTDAAINHGNSGGPLINQTGEVIGINTEGFQKDMAEGLNFAISINDVKNLVKEGQALSDVERTRDALRLEAKLQQQQQKREERAQEASEQTARAQRQEDSQYKDQIDQIKNRIEKAQKRQVLQACFTEAAKKIEDRWDDECRSFSKPSRCRLPAQVVDHLQGIYLEAQSDCIKNYGE
jgi:S1-C subfamily serine protease